jgi:hypothetical protein
MPNGAAVMAAVAAVVEAEAEAEADMRGAAPMSAEEAVVT